MFDYQQKPDKGHRPKKETTSAQAKESPVFQYMVKHSKFNLPGYDTNGERTETRTDHKKETKPAEIKEAHTAAEVQPERPAIKQMMPVNPTVVPSAKQRKTAQMREIEEDIRQNKPRGMGENTYLKISDQHESSKMVAQAKWTQYKKSQVKQLKRNAQGKIQFNSKVRNFEQALVQRKIAYGSEEYHSMLGEHFPDFSEQQQAAQTAAPVQKKPSSTGTPSNSPTSNAAAKGVNEFGIPNNLNSGLEHLTDMDVSQLHAYYYSQQPAQLAPDSGTGQAQGGTKPKNETGMPDKLKAGIEHLSGMSMNDVRVHHNSDKPAQMQAHAYAQGTDIHLAPGQEKHLPHEAWHVAQQKQGRVNPTMQMKGGVPVNDDKGLEREADIMGEKSLQFKKKDDEQLQGDSGAFLAEKGRGHEVNSVVQRAEQDYNWNALVDAHGQEKAADIHNTQERPDEAYRHNQVTPGTPQQGAPVTNLSIRANANQKTPFGKVKEMAGQNPAITYANGSLAQEQFTILDKPHEISLDISWPYGARPDDKVATPIGRMANDDFIISGQPRGGTEYDGGHLVGAVIYSRISNLDANIAPQERSLNEKFYNNVFEEIIRQKQTDTKKINMNVRVEYPRQNYKVTIGELQARGVINIDNTAAVQPDLTQEVEFVTRVPNSWYARAVFENGVLPGGATHDYRIGADANHELTNIEGRYGTNTVLPGVQNAHAGDAATGFRQVSEDLPANAGKTIHFTSSQKSPNYASSSAKQAVIDYYAGNQHPFSAERATAASGKNIAAIRQDKIAKLKTYYGADLKPKNVNNFATDYGKMRTIRDNFATLITDYETFRDAAPLSAATHLSTDITYARVLDRLKRRKGIIDRFVDPNYLAWLGTLNADFEYAGADLYYLNLAVDIHNKRAENEAYRVNARAYLTEVDQVRAAHDAAYQTALGTANDPNLAAGISGLNRLRNARTRMVNLYHANYGHARTQDTMRDMVRDWLRSVYVEYETSSLLMKRTRSQMGNPPPVITPKSYQHLQDEVRGQMNGHYFTLPAFVLNDGNTYDTIKIL